MATEDYSFYKSEYFSSTVRIIQIEESLVDQQRADNNEDAHVTHVSTVQQTQCALQIFSFCLLQLQNARELHSSCVIPPVAKK